MSVLWGKGFVHQLALCFTAASCEEIWAMKDSVDTHLATWLSIRDGSALSLYRVVPM